MTEADVLYSVAVGKQQTLIFLILRSMLYLIGDDYLGLRMILKQSSEQRSQRSNYRRFYRDIGVIKVPIIFV